MKRDLLAVVWNPRTLRFAGFVLLFLAVALGAFALGDATSSASRNPTVGSNGATEPRDAGTERPPVSTTTVPPFPGVLDCGEGSPIWRPTQLTLACGDASELGVDLTWSQWDSIEATATGLETWNTCVPSCAQSTDWESSAASFKLTFPVATAQGRIFTILSVQVEGPAAPSGIRIQTINEAPSGGPGTATNTIAPTSTTSSTTTAPSITTSSIP